MPVRVVAIDIDGTLLDSRWTVSEPNRRAVAAAARSGVEVLLVTGRRFDFARPVLDEVEQVRTIIVSNGALIKTREGATLERFLLPREIAADVLAATWPFREDAAVVFDREGPGQVVFERVEWDDPRRRAYFARNAAALAEVAPLDASLTEDPIQLMFTGAVMRMRALMDRLDRLPLRSQLTVVATEYEAKDLSIVDVTRAGCSKGSTLAAWCGRRGVAPEEVMAIGDNLNDRDMLEFAGVKVVMENCAPGLRDCGWPLTGSNDDHGVATAIERYVLSPETRAPAR